jgi:D-alanyl-D-alanine dipeptidase
MKHSGFIDLQDLCQNLSLVMSYSTTNNFTGTVVPGYKMGKALLALGPAQALARVQTRALSLGLSLRIFDSYRPVKAVQYFQDWSKLPETNLILKQRYYPGFDRRILFEQGFIARQSSHSRGCAVDLSLQDLTTGEELDMGTEFDFFHEKSFTDSPELNGVQRTNRKLLKDLMEEEGFKNFYQEWWHFSFKPEPFPDQYFDFDIE